MTTTHLNRLLCSGSKKSTNSDVKNRVLFFLYLLIALLTTGCKKLVELDPPKTESVPSAVFGTDASAGTAMTGLYASLINSSSPYTTIGYLGSLSADESDPTNAFSFYLPFGTNTLTPDNGNIQNLWSGMYATIFQANSIIENIQASKGMSDAVKLRYTGEAEFVRALSHYYLTNFFGPVPLITTTDVKTNVAAGRSDTATVYKQIIADLVDAQKNLPVDYTSYNNRRDRANQGAAAALLAKAYMATGDNAGAERAASAVISNSLYSLQTGGNIDNVFLKASPETIWAINPEKSTGHTVTTDATYYGTSSLYGALYGPEYVLLPGLINSFESGDLRKTHWINTFNYQGTDYYYGAKYKDYNPNLKPSEYDVVLRLSEQYLIRAEARIKQGNIAGAQSDLNIVRSRAGLGNTTASTSPHCCYARGWL
ncbi:SusD-like starch-binding protein associating with outer membrane [Mucilaginibacter gracilis]|uniref:SusD-like starch-binding protein associating with outer membrane n=1 Tax=Mucilaginibacter gracilis TaxID=423350 RepID=A0A495J1B9_9SPHI|nr:RagB/SusD family nutrient uptake outer membrane protein [Mucilaginibacter gracilis]RKR82421.1 SusD-like starch-binding protein associating with outer membrane [Mucilaginibacter gracilis]